jgi:hypothetical protein
MTTRLIIFGKEEYSLKEKNWGKKINLTVLELLFLKFFNAEIINLLYKGRNLLF